MRLVELKAAAGLERLLVNPEAISALVALAPQNVIIYVGHANYRVDMTIEEVLKALGMEPKE